MTGGGPITVSPNPDKLPFDPRSARLAAATEQLSKMAGHPVAFQLDAALLPEYRSSFEDELIEAIETVIRDLARLKKNSPAAFEHAAPLFQRIECRYRATAKRVDAHFDAAAHLLTIDTPAHGRLVERGTVGGALENEFEAYTDKLYSAMPPEQVPTGQRAAYFEYLSHRPSHRARGEKLTPQEELSNSLFADTILKAVRLSELVGKSDDALGSRIRDWLADQMTYFDNRYEGDAELVRAAPPESPWRRAEVAWVRWLNANLGALTVEKKTSLARVLFKHGRCASPCAAPRAAFPGFDAFAFGLAIENAWAKGGHTTSKDNDKSFELEDTVVCPHHVDTEGFHRRSSSCSGGWYLSAIESEPTKKRLVQAIVAQDDPVFTENVFANVAGVGGGSGEELVLMWRALEQSPKHWLIAGRVIVEYRFFREHTTELEAEANRLWRAAPDRRGMALYIMARKSGHMHRSYGDPFWTAFPKRFGESVSPAVFANYLDSTYGAMTFAPDIWMALGKGWSRAEVIVPRLDRYLDEPSEHFRNEHDKTRTLTEILERVCDEGNSGDAARLHAFFVKRSASHPTEAASLANIITDTAPGQCKATKP